MSKDLARIHDGLPELQRSDLLPSQVVSLLDRVDEPAVAVARIACAEMPIVVGWLDLFQSSLRHVRSEIDGNDLLALGVPRGPLYSRISQPAQRQRLDGLTHDRDRASPGHAPDPGTASLASAPNWGQPNNRIGYSVLAATDAGTAALGPLPLRGVA